MYLTDRVELIEGRIVAAGHAEGAFQLLRVLLESWTAHAALALVTDDFKPWLKALCSHFQISADELEKLIAADPFEPLPAQMNFTQLFPDEWPEVRRVLRNLLMSANQSNLRFAAGPGLAVKIGEDAPTPDFVIAQNHADLRFTERHLEGVPEIVVETVASQKDIFQLQKLYAGHGIPEVWVADIAKREFVVLQNRGGYYQPTSLLTGGVYHSVAVAGLVLNINLLWDVDVSPEHLLGAVLLDESGQQYNSILNYSRVPDHRRGFEKPASVRPGQLPFVPRIAGEPTPVTFEEFISWAPEPRFEIRDNHLLIPTRAGSRNLLGLLLQSIGLREAVAALPLTDWVTAIAERRLQIASSLHIKKYLAREVKRAAQILREKFGRKDLRTFGWFDAPPGMWTSVKIVDMKAENGGPPCTEISQTLRQSFNEGIEFLSVESLTPGERRLFEEHSLTL